MHMGSSFTSALTALGVGSALLVYAYNKDLQKCQTYAKVVAYFIVAGALLSMLLGAAYCGRGYRHGGHYMGGMMQYGLDCGRKGAGKYGTDDECCLRKDGGKDGNEGKTEVEKET